MEGDNQLQAKVLQIGKQLKAVQETVTDLRHFVTLWWKSKDHMSLASSLDLDKLQNFLQRLT